MRIRTRAACVSAAVAAVSFGFRAEADDLIWDVDPSTAGAQDGTGGWDLSTPTWLTAGGTNVAWDNVGPDNAILGGGTGTPGAFYNVDLAAPITVQNIILREVGGDAQYSLSTFSGGTLNLLGNIIKEGDNGSLNFFADTTLTTNHVVTMRDTPGDVPEFIFNGFLGGNGGLTIDNGTYEAWGTASVNSANTYTGVTNIVKGRLLLTNPGGLGATGAASGTVISNQGTLALYGAGTAVVGDLTINESITITRDQYSEAGGEFGRYDGAIQSNGGNNTLAGPITLNTTDARIQVNGGANSLTISGNINQASPSKLSKSGSGVLFLTGTNTYTGGTASRGGTVAFTTDANIGGATAPMFFDGGYFRVPATWTNFGAHPIDNTAFGGGLDTPGPSQVFVVAENLTGSNFNKRGVGSVNLDGTNVFTGDNFTDLGTVNVNGSTTARAIRIRNGTVNINSGGTYTTTGQWTSIGNDNGENGTLNVNGTGILRAGFNPTTNLPAPQDFNVSDNGNTTGTFNVRDQAVANIYGNFFVAKSANTNATVNQSGTSTINQNGNIIIGQGGTATGAFNKTGGTLAIQTGQLWVGNNGGGTGTFTQTAGATTINNWVAVGRATSTGTMNLDGGTFTKTGGGNVEVDFGGGGEGILNVRNDALLDVQGGELWVGQSGGSNGQLNIQDAGQVKVNNWFAVGRGGGTGTVNMSGGSLTKSGNGASIIGAGGFGTFNQTGGSFSTTNNSETWIGEGGTGGTWNMSGGTAGLARLDVGRNGTGTATLNVSGTANLTAGIVRFGESGGVTSTVNLDGGTLQATQLVNGGTTAPKTINLNGGLLKAGASSTTWFQGLDAANVKAGGARIDSNGFDVTAAQSLVHDPALGATVDGGLTKTGAGTLTLTGTNTYNGGTNVQAGTLQVRRMHENNPVNITGGKLQVLDSSPTLPDHPSGDNAFVSRPSALAIANNGAAVGARVYDGQLDLGNNDLIIDYDGASPRADIEDMVRAGYNGGDWLGNGINSSTANANRNFALAVADNALLTIPYSAARPFSGQEVDPTTILVKFTHRIDLDLDGVITTNDATIFNSNYAEGAAAFWSIGDLDYDRVFTSNDATLFNSFYSEALASVPEPATLGVLGIGALGLLGRRRRRSTCAAPARVGILR